MTNTVVVMLMSGSIAVIPTAVGAANIKHWCHMAIVVLVSACPCALILSTPVAIFCALTKAATTGLLLKGGDYLETLAHINTVAFDKTGTITKGDFTVTDFCAVGDDITIQLLLYWVTSIESKSSHPMAAALLEYGRIQRIKPIPENVENFQNFPGEGVFGKIDGKDIYIGNRKICARAGCEIESEGKEEGNRYICCGGRVVGMFMVSDSCRYGALEAIQELQSLGVKSAMLTGDTTHAAHLVHTQLKYAIDAVHAELLPHEKATIMENFKKEGATAMVGDGMNDAPALAASDIGISMGISGSALAIETGHAVLMSNDLRKIPEAIRLARRTSRTLIQNVVFSIATKTAMLALALAGYPLVWLAVLTDVGTCLLVILNSMLLLQEKQRKEGGSSRSKYGSFLGDKSQTLLEKQSDSDKCDEGCCSNVARQVKTPSATQGEASGPVILKTCNDGCCEEVRGCEEECSSRSTKRTTGCCLIQDREAKVGTQKCGSGTCGSLQRSKKFGKICCNDCVAIREIVIQ